MRKPIIAGNWKLHKNPQETRSFVLDIKDKLPDAGQVESLICAPAVDLEALKNAAAGSALHLGAENCYFEDEGAFTGETSPKVLREMGMDYCIIGHSERRGYFHESDQDVNKKAKAVFRNGLRPIICCGESFETRKEGKQEKWVTGQVKAALSGLTEDQVSRLVLAYEPIWAIGTGKTATAEQAEQMCAVIRQTVGGLYGQICAQSVRIQYGGSVNPGNIRQLLAKPDIDGGLVGGASLKPDSFLALLHYQEAK